MPAPCEGEGPIAEAVKRSRLSARETQKKRRARSPAKSNREVERNEREASCLSRLEIGPPGWPFKKKPRKFLQTGYAIFAWLLRLSSLSDG
jgi:hypothetical protein